MWSDDGGGGSSDDGGEIIYLEMLIAVFVTVGLMTKVSVRSRIR